MPRATTIVAARILLATAGVSSTALEDALPCPDQQRRYEAAKGDLVLMQMSLMLFQAADAGCTALGEQLIAEGGS